MPREGQIIPNWLHPHTMVVVNDNSKFEDDVNPAAENAVRFISVIASSKGRDRQVLTFDNISDALEEFGMPNYNLHGQPIYNAYAALSSGAAKVHMMRIMPDNATFANAVIVAKVKVESEKLKVKFESMKLDNFTDADSLAITMKSLSKVYPNAGSDGYSVYPIMGFMSQGRGLYGNNFRVRILSDLQRDDDNEFKNYRVEVLVSEKNLLRKESHSVSLYEMAIDGRETLYMDDVVNDVTHGSIRINTVVDHKALEDIYELWLGQNPTTENIVPFKEFDFLYGKTKAEKKAIEKFEIESDSFALDGQYGIILAGGEDGEFSTRVPKPKKIVANFDALKALTVLSDGMKTGDLCFTKDNGKYYILEDQEKIAEDEGWKEVSYDREAAMDKEYIKAFNGTGGYDNGLKSKRRCPAEVLMDANYSNEVKKAMVKMGLERGDCRTIMDAGILSTSTQVLSWADEFKSFNHWSISKECQHYQINDPYTGKRIPVTVTYFMSQFLAPHYVTFGNHVPFTGEAYSKIGGHVKNSLRPLIDADDLKVKEEIYKARINYFECIGENAFVRGTQGTSQIVWSDLSEENNVAVLLDIKRQAEDYVNKRFYNFAEPDDRKKFKEDVVRIFSSYPGKKCRSIDVEFGMNKWEEQRSILHCYIGVVYRTMAKRNIVEIDINSRV